MTRRREFHTPSRFFCSLTDREEREEEKGDDDDLFVVVPRIFEFLMTTRGQVGSGGTYVPPGSYPRRRRQGPA